MNIIYLFIYLTLSPIACACIADVVRNPRDVGNTQPWQKVQKKKQENQAQPMSDGIGHYIVWLNTCVTTARNRNPLQAFISPSQTAVYPFCTSSLFQAEHVADRYVTPKQFFNIIKPEDYDFYEVDYERLEVVALTESGEAIFCHNFTDVYRSYLNRAHHDDIQVGTRCCGYRRYM